MPVAEILAPFGVKYVAVEHVPGLIANALYPDRLFEGISDRNKIDAILVRQAVAQETHERLVRRHILSGELVTRDPTTMEMLPPGVFPSAILTLEDLESYVKRFDIGVSFDFVGIAEILPALAAELVDRRPINWRKPGHNNDLRRDVAIAITTIHLQHRTKEMACLGTIAPINGWPGDELIDDAQWGVTRRAAEWLRRSLMVDPPRSLWEHVNRGADEKEALHAQYARQEEAKRTAGRHTLRESANYIAVEGSEDYRRILKRLVEAAHNDEIATYPPGSNQRLDYGPQPRRSSSVKDFYEEVYWIDLNAWLERYEPRIACRFPNPQPERSADKVAGENKATLASAVTGQTIARSVASADVTDAFGVGTQAAEVINASRRRQCSDGGLLEMPQQEEKNGVCNGGTERSVRESSDPALLIIQRAYDAIYAETGKAPSQRGVTDRSGYARETVRSRWSQLKRLDQPD